MLEGTGLALTARTAFDPLVSKNPFHNWAPLGFAPEPVGTASFRCNRLRWCPVVKEWELPARCWCQKGSGTGIGSGHPTRPRPYGRTSDPPALCASDPQLSKSAGRRLIPGCWASLGSPSATAPPHAPLSPTSRARDVKTSKRQINVWSFTGVESLNHIAEDFEYLIIAL